MLRVFSSSSVVPSDIFYVLFLFSNLFFLSQADSYPVLPYGFEEFPNGHSDLYHAA